MYFTYDFTKPNWTSNSTMDFNISFRSVSYVTFLQTENAYENDKNMLGC